jgi:hypothetical protein
MPNKSTQATVLRRVNEVLKLIVIGAEFEAIRQFADGQGWQVSERQLRRYQESAYVQLAQTTQRNRKQLLGRHLMQRRALYAQALKDKDLRTALRVLRDEASLEGLYPPTKIAPTTPDGQEPFRLAVADLKPSELRALKRLKERTPATADHSPSGE